MVQDTIIGHGTMAIEIKTLDKLGYNPKSNITF